MNEDVKKPDFVHHLECGITACPLSALHGLPGNWPPGHAWDSDWDKVTCTACLRWRPKAT